MTQRCAARYCTAAALLLWGAALPAQTTVPIAFNDAVTSAYVACVPGGSAPCKVGENTGTPDNYDNAENYQNVFGANNIGFEQNRFRQVLVSNQPGTTTTIFTPAFYTVGNVTYPASKYVGATVDITGAPYPFTGAEAGCHAVVTAGVPYPGLNANATATSFSIASNVVTIVAPNSFQSGEIVVAGADGLQGFTAGTYLNGAQLTVATATSSQFTAAFTHANVASTTDSAVMEAQNQLTLGTACGAATQPGDIFTVTEGYGATPAAIWDVNSTLSGGAALSSDTATPQSGAQSLIVDTTTSGAYASFGSFYADADTHDRWRDISGTWQVSIYSKVVTGTGHFTLQVARIVSGTQINVCTANFTAASAWTLYQASCTPNEDSTLPAPGQLQFFIIQSDQTKNEYDMASFVKTSGRDATNTTIFQDETLEAEQFFDGGTSSTVWGVQRSWESQNAKVASDWLLPAGTAPLAINGDINQLSSPYGGNIDQLPDLLRRAQRQHRIPYVVIPMTSLDSDANAIINYLTVTQSGMTQPWVGAAGVFPTIHLEIGNENWNSGFFLEGLGYRANCGGTSCTFTDYLNRAGEMIAAMRANSNYTSAIRFVLNGWAIGSVGITSSNGPGTDWAHMVARGGAPDEIEVDGYKQFAGADFDTEQDQWTAALLEPYYDFHQTSDGHEQVIAGINGMSLCGPSGTAQCVLNFYEWGNNTVYPCGVSGQSNACGGTHSATLTANALTQFNQGAGTALVSVSQAIEQMQGGAGVQAHFALNGYGGTEPAGYVHIWHNTVDMGGAAAAANASAWGGAFLPSPSAIGLSMFNAAVIGRPFPCTASTPTFNFAGSNNGPLVALANVPYILTQCFADSSGHRTMVLVNNDQANSYSLTFSGSGAPSGTVTVKTLAPSSLNLTNEALGTAATNAFSGQVGPPTTSTVTNPAALTVAPHSVVVLSYSIVGTQYQVI